MRKAFATTALLLALTLPALAGEIPNPAPAPPQSVVAADGEIPNPRTAEGTAAGAVLAFLGSVLALF
jgi:hypothetical protein